MNFQQKHALKFLVFSSNSYYIYFMNIVTLTPEFLSLSSGLSQDSFAKTNTASLLSEKCMIVHINGKDFSYEPYFFDSTEADKNKIVFFKGKPVSGTLLSEILVKSHFQYSENDIFSLVSFFKAIDFISNGDFFTGTTGAGGIIIDADCSKNTATILFIASTLFEECARQHKERYPDLQGKFIYKGLDFPSSLYFLRSVVAYKVLTSHFPFESADTTKRQEDIFDENFIPLTLWNPQISNGLAQSIESAFKLKLNQKLTAGKRAITDSRTERKKQEILKKLHDFDSDCIKTELEHICKTAQNNDQQSETEKRLETARNSFIKKQTVILGTKRFLRRNKNRILASAAALLVLSWFASGIIRQNANLVTTRGLDSTQTTAVMYTMIHQADIPNLQEILKGKETKDLLVKMSGLYVSARQRLETSPDNGTLSPEKWFFYKKESKSWMFGITQLLIDGKPFQTENTYALKKEKPAALLQENEKTLKKGDEVTHSAQYYFVRQQESVFIIEKMRDTVTLRWNGKEWHVVKVEGSAKTERIKAKDFIDEYYTLIEEEKESESQEKSQSSVRNAIKKLSSKYSWLPTEEDLRTAAIFLRDEYGSREAEKFLQ